MQDALLIARDETERDATHFDRHALTALLETLGLHSKVNPWLGRGPARLRGGGLVIADGPFAETKEQILGLVLVARHDLDDVRTRESRSRLSAKEVNR